MKITGEVNARKSVSGALNIPQVVGGGGSITVDAALSPSSENPVQNKVIKAALDGKGTYSKPSGGIPKTDLASAVQTSLGKADTALQEHQDISGKAAVTSVPASASVSAAGVMQFKNADNTQLFTVQLPLYAGGVD